MAKGNRVLVLKGKETFLRERFLRRLVAKKKSEGVTVVEVDAAEASRMDLLSAMTPDMFSPGERLVVVTNPAKADLSLIQQHAELSKSDTTLLLHVAGAADGRTKFGKWAKTHKQTKTFEEVKPWEAADAAANFLVAECKEGGKTLDFRIARQWVVAVGTDYGFLSYEAFKAVTLASARGLSEIGVAEVKGVKASLLEADAALILTALAAKDEAALSRTLRLLKRTSKHDPTMRVLGLLEAVVIKWVQATYWLDLSPEDAAAELGQHPYGYKRNTLPPAQRWGHAGALSLYRDLAASKRAVLGGSQSAWLVLSSRLLSACRS